MRQDLDHSIEIGLRKDVVESVDLHGSVPGTLPVLSGSRPTPFSAKERLESRENFESALRGEDDGSAVCFGSSCRRYDLYAVDHRRYPDGEPLFGTGKHIPGSPLFRRGRFPAQRASANSTRISSLIMALPGSFAIPASFDRPRAGSPYDHHIMIREPDEIRRKKTAIRDDFPTGQTWRGHT
jgi:hypothetical protein